MERPTRYAKLDMYEYALLFSNNKVTNIMVFVETGHDVVIADIAGEITASDGNIYVDGVYCKFLEMRVLSDKDDYSSSAIVNIFVEEQ